MLVELVYTHDLKLCALLLKRSNRLRRNFFSLMELFNFFNTFSFFHIAISIFAFYILCSLFYNVLFSASEDFAFPSLLSSSLSFTCFISILTLFYSFDIAPISASYDLYTYNQGFLIVFLIVSSLVLFVTRDFVSALGLNKFEYDILFSFVILSAVCLCFSDDFLLIYLAIELQSLCFYVFATFNRNSEYSTESGLKYFIFGAVISCFLLLGFSLIYMTFGSTSFEFLLSIARNTNDTFLFTGIIFILIAMLFKVGAAPFHL